MNPAPPFALSSRTLSEDLESNSDPFGSSEHVHFQLGNALVAVDARDLGLVTAERSLGHQHAIALDDALGHVDRVGLHVREGVEPCDLVVRQGNEMVVAAAEQTRERGDVREPVAQGRRIGRLDEDVAREEDAADELPLAVDLLLGLVRRGVAVLDHVRQEAQHEPSRMLLSAARDLDHVE